MEAKCDRKNNRQDSPIGWKRSRTQKLLKQGLSKGLSQGFSKKGLFVQALTCQFALPALANESSPPPPIAEQPPSPSAEISLSAADLQTPSLISEASFTPPLPAETFTAALPKTVAAEPTHPITQRQSPAAHSEPSLPPIWSSGLPESTPHIAKQSFHQLPQPIQTEPRQPVVTQSPALPVPNLPVPTLPIPNVIQPEPLVENSAPLELVPIASAPVNFAPVELAPIDLMEARPSAAAIAQPLQSHSVSAENEHVAPEQTSYLAPLEPKAALSETILPPTDFSETASTDLPILIAGPQGLNPGLLNPDRLTPDRLTPSDRVPSTLPSSPEPPTDFQATPLPIQPLSPSQQSPTEPTFAPTLVEPILVEPITDNSTDDSTIPTADSLTDTTTAETNPFIRWEGLEVGLNNSFDSFGEGSWQINPTLRGQFTNGDRLTVSPGFNRFTQTDVEPVTHIPLTLGWQGNINTIALKVGGGIDFFDRLPATTHFNTTATLPLSDQATLSMTLEQGPHTFNARTLENQISTWRYGPDLNWQITPKVSLFSQLRLGNYSDGNWEQQSYSRLERKIGDEAAVALTLTNISFEDNVELTNGYFSPPDFLIATAELSWEEQIAKGLSCGLIGSLGQQRLEGEWALAYDNQVSCTVDVSAAIQMDIGYRYSNVSNDQSALANNSAYSNQEIFAGVRLQF